MPDAINRSLLQAAKDALAIAESYIEDEYDGTRSLADKLAELDHVRSAIRQAELAAKAAEISDSLERNLNPSDRENPVSIAREKYRDALDRLAKE